MRENMSIQYPDDIADNAWPSMKTPTTESMSLRPSALETVTISGKEAIATTQAYTVISKPALDSVMAKSPAIPLRSPIGMNSDVLKMKAAKVNPITGHQPRPAPLSEMLDCIPISDFH